MNRQQKEQEVQSLRAMFAEARSAYLMEYRGLTVEQMTQLRRKVRGTKASYRVVKNTLAALAADGTPLAPLKDQFTGPIAVALTSKDAVALAKVFKEFAKDAPALKMRAGVVDGRPVTAQDVAAIADLPSREELLGKLAYLFAYPIQSMANVLKAPLTKTVFALEALKPKKS